MMEVFFFAAHKNVFKNLGDWSYLLIGIAAFTTMFSTTLTTLDASPRVMNKSIELISEKKIKMVTTIG